MKEFVLTATILMLVVSFASFAVAQEARTGKAVAPQAAPAGAKDWVVPEGSIERPEDAGVRAHTNIVFRSLDGTNKPTRGQSPAALAAIDPLVTVGEYQETPNSLGCLYVHSPTNSGCVPNYSAGSGGPSAAGYGAIAVVEAGDDSTFFTDMTAFDSYWGLPGASLVKIYMRNSCQRTPDCSAFGWCAEDALDSEYAHVYASKATIVMVEACSSSYTDLLAAEAEAFNYISTTYGGGQVSNSWGSGEFSGENSYDIDFSVIAYGLNSTPITAFASAGDNGCGAAYPSSNPWLVSAGGTSIFRTTTNGHFNYEGCWSGSGGGTSGFEVWASSWAGGTDMGAWADYQYPLFGAASRSTPDFASNSDPNSGVDLYQASQYGGWTCCWGGTSEAAPSLAAIVNRAGNRLGQLNTSPLSSEYYYNGEDTLLYSQLPTEKAYKTNFYDITKGSNGCSVAKGWDYCTGVGAPRGLLGK